MENEIIKFNQNGIELNVQVTPDKDTVWLTLDQMAYLYKKDRSTIGEHVRNIYKEGELDETTSGGISPRSTKGKTRPPKVFNLDVIISVGYRVKSPIGVAFRKWANGVLKEYIIKGVVINEKRLLTLGKTIDIQSRMLASSLDVETDEIYMVIEAYDQALGLLDDYDHQIVAKPRGSKALYKLSYKECCNLISKMPFTGKSAVFGIEKEQGKVAAYWQRYSKLYLVKKYILR
ncbi:MAG: RhuM family protein [Longicatena sp.]